MAEGKKRRRQRDGGTPSEVLKAQRRKQNELIGELVAQGHAPPEVKQGTATTIVDAVAMFLEHVKTHTPQKPLTVKRYRQVLEHFERLLGHKKYVEAITRADIDDYKMKRSAEADPTAARPHPAR